MTDSNDDLIQRLAAADPVDPGALPSGTDHAPQQLLENLMTTDSTSGSTTQDQDQEVELLDLPTVRGIDRYRQTGRNRMRVLATVAAALLLAVGFIVFSPDNTSPALATVHSAAQTTADFDSGRVDTTFSFDGTDGEESGSIGGEVLAEFSGTDIRITGSIDESSILPGEAPGVLPPNGEARLVDGVLYVSEGEGDNWYAVETGGLIGQTVVDFVDPRSVLAEVEDLVETTEVGTVVIDGVDTTQYQSVVDVNDESLRETGWLPIEAGTDLEAEGEITVDLYIDGDGVLRRLGATGDLVETGGEGTATFTITTNFYDLGADISIEPPAEATLIDPEADFDLDDLELTD